VVVPALQVDGMPVLDAYGVCYGHRLVVGDQAQRAIEGVDAKTLVIATLQDFALPVKSTL
jgi:hypothetical protein